MFDNILDSLKRGAQRARSRGEEVAQTTRLRFEVYQLNRDLDALYGRLGRAYHSGAEVAILQPMRDEIARIDEEIAARERLITELSEGEKASGTAPDRTADSTDVPHEAGTTVVTPMGHRVEPTSHSAPSTTSFGQGGIIGGTPEIGRPVQPAPASAGPTVTGTVPTPPASTMATPGVPSAASVYHTKRQEENPMAHDDQTTNDHGLTNEQERNPLITSSNERSALKDKTNEDYQQRIDQGQQVSPGTKTDADLHGSDAPIPRIGTQAGNAQGILRAPVTPNVDDTEVLHDKAMLREEHIEAERASRDPSPLED
ncbi:hypothetical protein [Deinococcus peraridilitoris]|uniref:Uncharacterized protein n=1 Tax=Deinococcus peraridilitoris (strain DSM 19664 / LMG 22246 / CIP 109416 / KR-200) TaxID=937777 RepID=L0A6C5_DEIPD|nr:hypothetical protein [Deinococcus peraridilitoris]AFZ68717.1 hypothetical protein Deipe_3275 [Deinococcus peraridilitoris DSM 19664]